MNGSQTPCPGKIRERKTRMAQPFPVLILHCLAILVTLRPQATYSLTTHFDLVSDAAELCSVDQTGLQKWLDPPDEVYLRSEDPD